MRKHQSVNIRKFIKRVGELQMLPLVTQTSSIRATSASTRDVRRQRSGYPAANSWSANLRTSN
jgi:hypothetical protein